MLFSEALRRPVMSISSATSLGAVDGFVVDVKRPQVVALNWQGRIRSSSGTGSRVSDLTQSRSPTTRCPPNRRVAFKRWQTPASRC